MKRRPNVRKLLNVRINLCDLGFDNRFFTTTPKAQTTTSTNKRDFINVEIFGASKDTTKNEKNPQDGRKYLKT